MNVINIGNSIIGVSILAMPYCFSKCGILLSIILIIFSGLLTKLACFLLLKSAVIARRRSFEFLAFHTFGSYGKLIVEMSVIGFLIGVCIAFFVVIGDLGPPLAVEFLNIEKAANLRTNVLILVGLCVALPLGLLRKIDSLTSLSVLSIAFYVCLIIKIFAEAVPNLTYNEWWYTVNWWRSEGILPCLPIFSMALSCQTQLFEFFDTTNDPSIKRMQYVIDGAVCLCSAVYVLVGTFGYIAFHDKIITGNILVLLTPSAITEIIKLGFILTVAVSFPLCLFPCRSSLHSLLFKQGFVHHDINVNIIPDHRFRILTVSLISVTIGIAIMLPNIEFVLGIIGSTIGTLICLILPAIIFINDSQKMTTEHRKAQVLFGIGTFILIACTISTLQENSSRPAAVLNVSSSLKKPTLVPLMIMSSVLPDVMQPPEMMSKETPVIKPEKKIEAVDPNFVKDQKRLEPPVPQEPDVKVEQNGDLDPQALRKEDKELLKEVNHMSADLSKKEDGLQKQEILLKKLEEQHEEQKLILEAQKKVLQELKQHKESHELIEKQEAEKKKEKAVQDPEKNKAIQQQHEDQKSALEKPKEALPEPKQEKVIPEIIEVQTSAISKQGNVRAEPKEGESVEIIPKVENTPPVHIQGMNHNVELKTKQEVKVVPSNNSFDTFPKQKPKQHEDIQMLIKKQQDNEVNIKKLEEIVFPKKGVVNEILNKTSADIKDTIQNPIKNLSFNISNGVPNILNIQLPVKKEPIKPSPESIDPDLIVKRRETLAKKVDFEATVSLPTQDINLNVVVQHDKNEA